MKKNDSIFRLVDNYYAAGTCMQGRVGVFFAALLTTVLLSPFASSEIVYSGVIAEIDDEIIAFELAENNTLTLVTSNGTVKHGVWQGNTFSESWRVEFNITALNAAVSNDGSFVAIAVGSLGVKIINLSTGLVFQEILINVDAKLIAWDRDNDLWIGGPLDATEFRLSEGQFQSTGTLSSQHGIALRVIDFLIDGRIVTGGQDKKIKISNPSGQELVFGPYPGYPTSMLVTDSNYLLIGLSTGALYKVNLETNADSFVQIPDRETPSNIAMNSTGIIRVGTLSGSFHLLSFENLTTEQSFDIGQEVIHSWQDFSNRVFVTTVFSNKYSVHLFDVDRDGDGVGDLSDIFPDNAQEWSDTDGDGVGDNADDFPNDGTESKDSDMDGVGDNSDQFPTNASESVDSDGDGIGDNADIFPDNSDQWYDQDSDGFGDNSDGENGDDCPQTNGFSNVDQRGCPDSDFDGWSDSGDAFPIDRTQTTDIDGDGYGDNSDGIRPDSCIEESGTSTKAWVITSDSLGQLAYTEQVYYGCLDSDNDGWADEGDDLPQNPAEYRDSDGDGVGFFSDYNDEDKSIQTEKDHCEFYLNITTEICEAWRSEEYQTYVAQKTMENKEPLPYFLWNKSQSDATETESEIMQHIKDFAIIGGAIFVVLFILILGAAGLSQKRKKKKLIDRFGVPFDPTKSIAQEALEGEAGISGFGGIEGQEHWDDEVQPMDLSDEKQHLTDEDILAAGNAENNVNYDDGLSIEDLAGNKPETEKVEPQINQPETPPLPAEGLPEGWTMEQWKWYGAQWLASKK